MFSGALDLLKVNGFDAFQLKNQSGQIVNIASNTIQDAVSNLIIPIDVDSDDSILINSETDGNEGFLCWIENNSPITIQGADSSIGNIILTSNLSVLSVDASTNSEVTLSASSWHSGGNTTEIKPVSNKAVSIKNHYYDYDDGKIGRASCRERV